MTGIHCSPTRFLKVFLAGFILCTCFNLSAASIPAPKTPIPNAAVTTDSTVDSQVVSASMEIPISEENSASSEAIESAKPVNKTISAQPIKLPVRDPVVVFAVVLCVMLFLPLIFDKLHVPGILGIIVAGIILGPNGLQILAKDSSVVLFGTVGIVYLMFFSGLEVDFNDFRKSSLRSFIFGSLTFMLPQVIGTLGNLYILKMDLQSSLLLASTYASHTLLTYPLVSKLGVKKNEAVVIAIGGTIVTNTASLAVLALTTVETISASIVWKMALNFGILCIIALVILPQIAKLFFKYMDGDGVQHFLFVLGSVFTVAAISQMMEIEAVIGAFLAGLGLNRFITEGSVLINRLEFTGNALFIPYFLLYVGMLVDPESFTQNMETWLYAAVMTFTAMGTKWIAAYFSAKGMKLSKEQGNLIFGLSNAQAANTLAAVLVGHKLGILNDQALNGTVVMILVTCVVSAIASERAAKAIASADDQLTPRNSQTDQMPERIIVPIAKQESIPGLVETASLLKHSNTPIYPLSIVSGTDQVPQRKKAVESMLMEAVKACSASDQLAQLISRVDVSVTSGIVNATLEHAGSGLVMGASVKNMFSGFFPTILKTILAELHCAVTIVRKATHFSLTQSVHIIVPRHAEHEAGFNDLIKSTLLLCQRLKAKPTFYLHPETQPHVQTLFDQLNSSLQQNFIVIERDKGYPRALPKKLNDNDLLLFIMARESTLSYSRRYEKFTQIIQLAHEKVSQIDLYPATLDPELRIQDPSCSLITAP